MSLATSRSGASLWLAVVGLLTVVTSVLLFGPPGDIVWASPLALFVIVTVAASLCIVAAGFVVLAGHRRELAEVGILGTGLMVVSILPLVHGLTAPGVLYGPNKAVSSSAYLSLPVGLLAWSPLLARRFEFGRLVARHWRAWSLLFIGGSALLAAGMLIRPQVALAPTSMSAAVVVFVGVQLVAAMWLSVQQLRLYEISQNRSAVMASLALALLALTTLVWLGGAPFGLGWWFVHLLDIVGVLGGCVGVLRTHRLGRSTVELLAPVLALDPLAALEVGLSPEVHRFVAALEAKDPITRDHVVRTAALAMRVGSNVGLPARRLRNLGLGALLHDIGKLRTPDEILSKPGKLTAEEYMVIQQHPVDGDALVRSIPSLVPIAPFVRGHHERIDGTGYPDRLAGWDIPLEARIIAACDAYDAMVHTRQYREGMGFDRAATILREHAGRQWDADLVAVVVLLGPTHDGAPLLTAGRVVACDCADALPDDVRVLLETPNS